MSSSSRCAGMESMLMSGRQSGTKKRSNASAPCSSRNATCGTDRPSSVRCSVMGSGGGLGLGSVFSCAASWIFSKWGNLAAEDVVWLCITLLRSVWSWAAIAPQTSDSPASSFFVGMVGSGGPSMAMYSGSFALSARYRSSSSISSLVRAGGVSTHRISPSNTCGLGPALYVIFTKTSSPRSMTPRMGSIATQLPGSNPPASSANAPSCHSNSYSRSSVIDRSVTTLRTIESVGTAPKTQLPDESAISDAGGRDGTVRYPIQDSRAQSPTSVSSTGAPPRSSGSVPAPRRVITHVSAVSHLNRFTISTATAHSYALSSHGWNVQLSSAVPNGGMVPRGL